MEKKKKEEERVINIKKIQILNWEIKHKKYQPSQVKLA